MKLATLQRAKSPQRKQNAMQSIASYTVMNKYLMQLSILCKMQQSYVVSAYKVVVVFPQLLAARH